MGVGLAWLGKHITLTFNRPLKAGFGNLLVGNVMFFCSSLVLKPPNLEPHPNTYTPPRVAFSLLLWLGGREIQHFIL